jgi:hypothetical protein
MEMTKTLLMLTESKMSRDLKDINELQVYPPRGKIDAQGIKIIWAPFDFINRNARLAIIGVTPGPTQAMRSYRAARRAADAGTDPQVALEKAKAESSFRGDVIEPNLKSLLEHSGVAERVGIEDVDQIWTGEAHKLHFTSTVRYPTFINDELFNNQINSLGHTELRRYIETYLVEELRSLPIEATIVVLGKKGPRIVQHAAKIAKLDAKRIVNLPHPSGNANGAVRDYLSKTKTQSIRPCRCMLCDRSRIPDGWDLSKRYTTHDRTHDSIRS